MQSPLAWYSHIESYFLKFCFQKFPYEHSLFVKIGESAKLIIVYLYFDDLIFTGNDNVMFSNLKRSMMDELKKSDLGKMHFFVV